MPLAISFLLAALAIAEPLILCSKVVYAALPTLLKLRTIGELIVTLFAASGTAITNPVVVPAIYQAGNYSIEYLVEEDILNVEGHPEYTDEEVITNLGTGKAFNLDTTGFRNLMETNWQSMRDYQIDAVMRLNEIANTDSMYGAIDNIGGILQDVCKYGYCGFENSIALVSNPLTAVKVSLENIKDSIISVFGNRIRSGVEIIPTVNSNVYLSGLIEYIDSHGLNEKIKYIAGLELETGEDERWFALPEDIYVGIIDKAYIYNKNNNEMGAIYNWKGGITTLQTTQPSINNWRQITNGSAKNIRNVPEYTNGNEMIEAINNGNYFINNKAKDIVGVDGNIDENSETGIKNGQGIDIIEGQDYNEFIEDANENSENGEYEENAILYDNLINNNEVTAPEEEPEPIIPAQPTDFPVRPTLTPEQTVQSMKGATPGITEFFPFCIPGDIVALFGSLNVEARQAPIITWNWKIERFGIDEEIIIDFSPYDTVASILRNLELILFIIGLAVATRNLIGA